MQPVNTQADTQALYAAVFKRPAPSGWWEALQAMKPEKKNLVMRRAAGAGYTELGKEMKPRVDRTTVRDKVESIMRQAAKSAAVLHAKSTLDSGGDSVVQSRHVEKLAKQGRSSETAQHDSKDAGTADPKGKHKNRKPGGAGPKAGDRRRPGSGRKTGSAERVAGDNTGNANITTKPDTRPKPKRPNVQQLATQPLARELRSGPAIGAPVVVAKPAQRKSRK